MLGLDGLGLTLLCRPSLLGDDEVARVQLVDVEGIGLLLLIIMQIGGRTLSLHPVLAPGDLWNQASYQKKIHICQLPEVDGSHDGMLMVTALTG